MVLRNSISLSCCVIIANRVSSYFVGAFDIVFGLLFPSWLGPVTSHAPVCNLTPTPQCSRHASRHLPHNAEQKRKFLGNESVIQRVTYVPSVLSLSLSRKVKGVEEGGKGGWGGITSLGRIERCCLVRRTDDGTCAALQTLVQHVQHIRGSNRVAHHQWCRLNRFACPDWLCACVRRKEVIARKRLERAQDKDGASGFLFRQTPSVARRGCKLCPV